MAKRSRSEAAETNGTATAVADAPTRPPGLRDILLADVFERAGVGEVVTAALREDGLITLDDLDFYLGQPVEAGGEKLQTLTDLPDITQARAYDIQRAIREWEAAHPEPSVDEAVQAAVQDGRAEMAAELVADGHPTAKLSIEEREAVWRKISELEADCQEDEAEWVSAKEAASEAKKAFDASVERLRKAIRAANEPLPLFDGKAVKLAPSAAANPSESPNSSSTEDESWRAVPLSEVLMDLPPKKVQILADAELTTLGQLTDFQAAKSTYAWDLKGVGPEWRTKIEDAVVTWLARWREQHPAAVAEAGDAEPEEAEEAVKEPELVGAAESAS